MKILGQALKNITTDFYAFPSQTLIINRHLGIMAYLTEVRYGAFR
jgi:hypothetical protein